MKVENLGLGFLNMSDQNMRHPPTPQNQFQEHLKDSDSIFFA